jgi:hypothetical protein
MPSPGLRHPALASVAARAATSGSPSVSFDITHDGPETGVPPMELTPPTAPDRTATETLAFHVAGVGFQVHTWPPVTPSKQQDGVTTSRIAVHRHETNGHARGLFAGSVVINPDFLYDTEHSVEILVTLNHEQWRPNYADSLMIMLAYQGMTAAAAADGGVPVLFLQSPVAPFRDPSPHFRLDGSGESPRMANGMALRMLVGLDQDNHGRRIALMCALAELATENGFGLQVADRRFGRRAHRRAAADVRRAGPARLVLGDRGGPDVPQRRPARGVRVVDAGDRVHQHGGAARAGQDRPSQAGERDAVDRRRSRPDGE